MRVVVDTNVFVSAALKESSWPGMVIRWLDESGPLLKTAVIEAQVIEVLQRPYFAPKLPAAYLDRCGGYSPRRSW
jgi:predicted nucleic acid-binding protein